MIIKEYMIEDIFNKLDKTAHSLMKNLTVEKKDIDFEEVELKIELLKSKFEELRRFISHLKTDRISAFGRHISFIIKDPYAFGESNLSDIINIDLPTIKQLYYEDLKSSPHLDIKLRKQCENLILNCEYDSAIRKAFIVLKERAVKNFDLPQNIDGDVLVKKLFSPNSGLIIIDDDQKKRLEFMNYCTGLFGYFRNSFAHNLVDNPEFVVETVISSINMLLKILEDESKYR